jgi:adenylate cyclase class 2
VLEHELKAVVVDPILVRARLIAAGARPGFRGLMSDVRYDKDGELLARDEALRLRTFRPDEGPRETILGWKGPTRITGEGYKTRPELEYDINARTGPPEELLLALGFRPIHAIDRYVEYYHLGTADVRLEWYPRMDVLIEVEGDGPGIEAGILAAGLPRAEFTAESLPAFAARYAERTGRAPLLSSADLAGESPSWSSR